MSAAGDGAIDNSLSGRESELPLPLSSRFLLFRDSEFLTALAEQTLMSSSGGLPTATAPATQRDIDEEQGERSGESTRVQLAPNTTGNDESGRVIGENIQQQLAAVRLQFERMNNQEKFTSCFLLILALKLVADYLACTLLLLTFYNTYKAMRDFFDVELSLKTKTRLVHQLAAFIFNALTLIFMWLSLQRMGYSEELHDHLALRSASKDSATLFETLWNCIVMNVFIQLLVLQVKITLSLMLASLKEPEIVRVFQLCGCMGVVQRLTEQASTLSQPALRRAADVERGQTQQSASLTYRGAETTGLLTAAAESDESSTHEVETWDYRLRSKICKMIDIVAFVYQSLLPIPLWLNYFAHGWGSSWYLFSGLYFLLKCGDISWKLRGGYSTLVHMVFNKLEFGHYSTSAECVGGRDCPVCFESPNNPVTLDCAHVFCETCISEWLEKEKTCPVCRAEVASRSPYMRDVRRAAASVKFIFV